MTKMSTARKEKKGLVASVEVKVKSNLTPEETLELQEMIRLINSRHFEVAQIKNNTALIEDGQKFLKQMESLSQILEGVKSLWVNQKLAEHGYVNGTKCQINLTTGHIIESEDEPTNS